MYVNREIGKVKIFRIWIYETQFWDFLIEFKRKNSIFALFSLLSNGRRGILGHALCACSYPFIFHSCGGFFSFRVL